MQHQMSPVKLDKAEKFLIPSSKKVESKNVTERPSRCGQCSSRVISDFDKKKVNASFLFSKSLPQMTSNTTILINSIYLEPKSYTLSPGQSTNQLCILKIISPSPSTLFDWNIISVCNVFDSCPV